MIEKTFIDGPVGKLETLILKNTNDQQPIGFAIVLHPNPLQGGSNTNKVVTTLAKSLNKKGYVCYLPNLRGVGQSDGIHDFGKGEIEDVLSIINYATKNNHSKEKSVALAGFSFGAYVASFVVHKTSIDRLILVGAAVTKYPIKASPLPSTLKDVLIIHGSNDNIVPIEDIYDWTEKQNLPVVVIPGAVHFFHQKLIILANILDKYFI